VSFSPSKRGYKCYQYLPSSHRYYVSEDVTFRENVSYFTRPQPKRENTNESDFEFEFLISSFPKTSRLISLIPDYTPQPKLSPILSESTSSPNPESTPSLSLEFVSIHYSSPSPIFVPQLSLFCRNQHLLNQL
jgi:hypothetical protein